jgi:hypothetical protein
MRGGPGGLTRVDLDRRPRLRLAPNGLEVAHPDDHLPHDVVRLVMLPETRGSRIREAHRPDARLRVQRVSPEPERLLHGVLEESVDDDDVPPDELRPAGHALAGDQAVVHDELEVEGRHPGAGVAVALRCLGDVAETTTEGDIAALDRVLEEHHIPLTRAPSAATSPTRPARMPVDRGGRSMGRGASFWKPRVSKPAKRYRSVSTSADGLPIDVVAQRLPEAPCRWGGPVDVLQDPTRPDRLNM